MDEKKKMNKYNVTNALIQTSRPFFLYSPSPFTFCRGKGMIGWEPYYNNITIAL
jgi:hypothetical protein